MADKKDVHTPRGPKPGDPEYVHPGDEQRNDEIEPEPEYPGDPDQPRGRVKGRTMYGTLEEQFDADFDNLPEEDRTLLLALLHKLVKKEGLPKNTYRILCYWANCVHGEEDDWLQWSVALYRQFETYNDEYFVQSEWSFDNPEYIYKEEEEDDNDDDTN